MALAELTELQTQPLPTPCPPQDLLLQQMAEQGGEQTSPKRPLPSSSGGGRRASCLGPQREAPR